VSSWSCRTIFDGLIGTRPVIWFAASVVLYDAVKQNENLFIVQNMLEMSLICFDINKKVININLQVFCSCFVKIVWV